MRNSGENRIELAIEERIDLETKMPQPAAKIRVKPQHLRCRGSLHLPGAVTIMPVSFTLTWLFTA